MPLLTSIVLLPLAGALAILLIPRNFRPVIRAVALLATLLSAIFAVVLFCQFNRGTDAHGFQFVQQIDWGSRLGVSYHVGVDGLNVGLILMGAVVSFAAVCVSHRITSREKEFYILLLTMAGGVLGAFASLDLFFFYFFHELALVPAFIMIGVWGRGERKNFAAFQITLYLSAGALLVLLGLIALYLRLPADQRSFDYEVLARWFQQNPMDAGAQRLIFPLLLFGFGILVSLWPFHTWAPIGYGSAPSGAAMIHAGVLKKFGLYGLIRVAIPFMPDAAKHWAWVLSLLCLGNIVYCGLVAMRQRDLNMLIGNSSVAHMGFAFLGIASWSLLGVTGAVVIMVAHGFLAALSYALTGYLDHEVKTLDINQMGGLLRQMPFIGSVMIMAMMAGCGLPGFAGFPGELMVLFASWKISHLIAALAIWGALVIGGVYMLRAIRDVWHGDKPWDGIHDAANLWRKLPFALLLAGLLVFGFFPRLLTDGITTALASGPNPVRADSGAARVAALAPEGGRAQ